MNAARRLLGRIVGNSVLELAFRCGHDADVCVGDLLVAEDDAGGEPYLFRVTNVRYGLEGEKELAERMAGRMLTMEAHGDWRPDGFWDKDHRMYKIGVGVPLGYVRGGRFRKAKSIPRHFASVRRADADDYAFLEADMGDLEVGFLRSGETTVPFPVGIRGDVSIPYHIGIFATTGMGKSNLMRVLAASVLSTGRYGLLLVDPHGEYYDGGGRSAQLGLRHHPLADRNLRVYSARKLRGPYLDLRVSTHEIEVGDLKQLFDFSEAQKDFLDGARRKYGGAWLAEVHEKPSATLAAEVPGTRFEGPVDVVKRKIARLFENGLLHRDPHVTCTKPLVEDLRAGKVVLVDTGGLREHEELLVATVLARAVFAANRDAFDDAAFDDIPPILIAVEEAQRVLGRANRVTIFADIAREGRKFKTGLCAITQQPKLVDREVLSQFNTLFIMGLADRQDRETLRDSAKQDVSQLENEIQTLMPGEVLITSPYAPFAVPARVHLYEEYVDRLAKTAPPPPPPRPRPGDDFY